MSKTDTQEVFRNRTMSPCTIIPELGYDDVAGAIEWLCGTLGFTERWRAGSHRAQLMLGNGAVVLYENPAAGGQAQAGSEQRPSLLVRVQDVMAHYNHARQQGAAVAHPPADYPYGERQYTITDPGGHRWTFSQSIADVAPEDWGGTTARGFDLH